MSLEMGPRADDNRSPRGNSINRVRQRRRRAGFAASPGANTRGIGWQLFNEPEDRRPAAFVIGFFMYQLLVFSLVRNPWTALALIAGPHFVLQIPLVTVLHHSIHRPLFRHRAGEFLLGLVCFLAVGFTRTCFKLDHLTHHRYYLVHERDTNAWHRHAGALGRQRYSLHHLALVYPRTWRIATRRRRLLMVYLLEANVGLAILALLFSLDFAVTLAVFVHPMVYGMFGTYYWSHHEHAGLRTQDHFTASRTYLSPTYNWLAFNVGYHAAHHYRPAVHWSRLPQLHETIMQAIPEPLMIQSVPWFSSDYAGVDRDVDRADRYNRH